MHYGLSSNKTVRSRQEKVRETTVSPTIRIIDLFAGAGGLSLGFHLANSELDGLRYESVLAVEHDRAAALTYKTNFDVGVYDGDIEAFDPVIYPEAELIIGGPPCQGFSPLGRDRDNGSRTRLNSLWTHYLDAVQQVEPLAFVIENVPEFQKSDEFGVLLKRMASHPLLKEYSYEYGVLNAANYGVPQRRQRGVFVAMRGRQVRWPPAPSHGDGSHGKQPAQTVRDAISDLPREPTTDEPVMRDGFQDLHIRRNPRPTSLQRYRVIPEGGNRFDLQRERPDLTPRCWANKPTGTTNVMGRLWWERPSVTIRTEFFKPEKGRYLHPSEHRPITHREAARLQSFPDSFIFAGTKIEIARQIGNAVPPLLGKVIALHLADLLQ